MQPQAVLEEASLVVARLCRSGGVQENVQVDEDHKATQVAEWYARYK